MTAGLYIAPQITGLSKLVDLKFQRFCVDMNNKQKKILRALFFTPIRKNILWADVVSLIQGLGEKSLVEAVLGFALNSTRCP